MSYLIREIESRIGIFECALSYAEDGAEIAKTIEQILRYQEISTYNYKSETVSQSGFDLVSIMDYVYGHVRAAVIVNSERYRQTQFTMMEYDILCSRQSEMHIYVVQTGGCDLAVCDGRRQRRSARLASSGITSDRSIGNFSAIGERELHEGRKLEPARAGCNFGGQIAADPGRNKVIPR